MELKDTNPKDAIGSSKSILSNVPMQVIYEAGLGMLEGSCKYGRYNYRVAGVRASIYYEAAVGHMNQWWEGEDIDADSGLSHVTKAITSLIVLRDAMLNDMLTDDRPPSVKNTAWIKDLRQKSKEIIEKYKDHKPKQYSIADTYKDDNIYNFNLGMPVTITVGEKQQPDLDKFPLLRRASDFPNQ